MKRSQTLLLTVAALLTFCAGALAQIAVPPLATYYIATATSVPAGDDGITHNGTIGLPFLTLQHTLDVVKTYKITHANYNVEIRIRAGEYRLTQTILITHDHTVDDTTSLTITAYKPTGGSYESVLIHGGRQLTRPLFSGGGSPAEWWAMYYMNPEFQPTNTVPGMPPPGDDPADNRSWEFRDLYLDNARLIRARFPNPGDVYGGYLHVDDSGCSNDPIPHACAQDVHGGPYSYAPGRWLQLDQSLPGYLHEHMHRRTEVVGRHDWTAPRQIIEDADFYPGLRVYTAPAWPLGMYLKGWMVESSTGAGDSTACLAFSCFGQAGFTTPCDTGTRPPFGVGVHPLGDYVYFENAKSFLDSDYEWFFDSADAEVSGRLTILLPAGPSPPRLNPNGHRLIAPTLDRLLIVRGMSEHCGPNSYVPVKNVRLTHLNFAFTHQALQTPAQDSLLTGGAVYDPYYECMYPNRGYTTSQAGYRTLWNGSQIPNVNFLPAAIQFYAVENCEVTYCRIAHTGAGGVQIYGDKN